MWSHRVVVFPPLFDDDLRLLQAVEDLPVEQFIPEPSVEARSQWAKWLVTIICYKYLNPVSVKTMSFAANLVQVDTTTNRVLW